MQLRAKLLTQQKVLFSTQFA